MEHGVRSLQDARASFGAEVDEHIKQGRPALLVGTFFDQFDHFATHDLMNSPVFPATGQAHFKMSHLVSVIAEGGGDLFADFEKPFAGITLQGDFGFQLHPAEHGFAFAISGLVFLRSETMTGRTTFQKMNHPILAIDHGEARIGLAATDEFGIGVHPVETIDCRRTEIIPRILEVIAERKIQSVILGLPLRMDGSEGTSSTKVRKFGKELKGHLRGLPLTFVDERFTTMTAAGKLREAGKNAKKQKSIIDQAAALEILKDHLGW